MQDYSESMGFKEWLSKRVLFFKKNVLYQSDAEKVTIRLESIPEWLYKITMENPEKIQEKVSVHFEELKTCTKELHISLEGVRLKDVLAMDISRYKKEVLATTKELYLKKMRQASSSIDKFTKDTSITDMRDRISTLKKELEDIEEKNTRSIEILEEFYSSEIPNVNKVLSKIKKVIAELKKVFETQGYYKVNALIELVDQIKNAQSETRKINSEIKLIDEKIDETQQHIFRLDNKIADLKESGRFKDVLKKESNLEILIQQRAEVASSFSDKIQVIQERLSIHAKNINETTLVSGYISNPDQALLNDSDLSITDVFESFLKECQKEESPLRKEIKENQIQKIIDAVRWLIINAENIQKDLIETDRKVKISRKYLKNYVILNEMEDNESRIGYYQEKLKEKVNKRKEKIDAISDLKIKTLKDKLYKELLILTGYDVEIIY